MRPAQSPSTLAIFHTSQRLIIFKTSHILQLVYLSGSSLLLSFITFLVASRSLVSPLALFPSPFFFAKGFRQDVWHVNVLSRLRDVQVAFDIFSQCFTYKNFFLFWCFPPLLGFRNQLIIYYSTLMGVFAFGVIRVAFLSIDKWLSPFLMGASSLFPQMSLV